jgi:Mn2+/Fe2+ NRAMP family transporter
MKKAAELFLGILTAMGGFVEIGELTFTLGAGVHFGYQLLWVTLVGTVGIMVYCEMAGRIAAVKRRPVFGLIRERNGFGAALLTLVAANAVNLLTCAAEVGGVAWLWQLMTGWPYRALLFAALAFFVVVVWLLPFQWIERVFGLGGLLMVVFVVALWTMQPQWGEMAAGLLPSMPRVESSRDLLLWAYMAVALMSAIMLPYETYFYASGGIEDAWTPSDIVTNRVVVLVGFALGGLLSVALTGLGAQYFGPRGIEPQLPGTAAMAASVVFAKIGLAIAGLGLFFAFAGAAIETALSAAYNLAQFAGWPWGKSKRPREAARFSLAWVAVFVAATAVVMTGVDPVQVVEVSIVFSVVVLPLTYLPVLLVARDRKVMGEHANGWFANVLGWLYLVAITVAAVAAIPLFLLTHGGRG